MSDKTQPVKTGADPTPETQYKKITLKDLADIASSSESLKEFNEKLSTKMEEATP